MPFDTDTAWPTPLRTIFEVARATSGTLAYRYSGPYDKLLNYCFNEFTYFVAPWQALRREDWNETIYLAVMDQHARPVFFIEVNHEDYDTRLFAPSAAKRFAADKQMRARYEDLLCLCSLPKLYGLSMMGTKMRVYVGDATLMTIDPPPVPRTTDVLPRT